MRGRDSKMLLKKERSKKIGRVYLKGWHSLPQLANLEA
jgi:hypothetical protein